MPEQQQTKTVGGEYVKAAAEPGSFEAVIATFDAIDGDGDVVEHGAFGRAIAPILPAHHQGSVPLGKASVEERGDQAVAVGRFNLATAAGREWFEALKFDLEHPPPRQQWSWGYVPTSWRVERRDDREVRVLEAVDLIEVSPVVRGASVGTRTLAAKAATARHRSATSDAAWDGPANERKLPSPVPVAAARQAFAWLDEGLIEEGTLPKSGARFIHHFIDQDGGVGAASTRACITGIAVLNGARGGTTVPGSDRSGIYNHLAGHLRDAGIEPPELRSAEEGGVKLSEQVRLVTWDSEAVVLRLREISDQRLKEGGDIAESTKTAAVEMAASVEEMIALSQQLVAMVKGCSPPAEATAGLERSVGLWQAHRARWST